MFFEEYEPKSSLVVPENIVRRAKYPFIDIHNHQRLNMSDGALDTLIHEMDKLNMRVLVNLSGRSGAPLAEEVQRLNARYPGRVLLFANVNMTGFEEPGWGERAANQLAEDVNNGARGLKIYKNFGMTLKDSRGERVRVDDRRFDPIWKKAGELGIPVLIHTADPHQFWEPHDTYNERWLELKERPERIRPPDQFPPFETIMAEQRRLFAKHPRTNFINAHLSWYGSDLARLGAMLDTLPNVYTEIGAVIAELGRQPHFARQWFMKYQDRVLFGKDVWAPSEYYVYFRVLETADEYFDYYRKRHAFWKMYGLELPDGVLKKLYYKNALRIIPGLRAEDYLH